MINLTELTENVLSKEDSMTGCYEQGFHRVLPGDNVCYNCGCKKNDCSQEAFFGIPYIEDIPSKVDGLGED